MKRRCPHCQQVLRPELSAAQRAVLEYVRGRIQRTKRAPTLVEIARSRGMSGKDSVRKHLETLAEKGYLIREAYSHRAHTLTEKGLRTG